jgi:hypothetical protein
MPEKIIPRKPTDLERYISLIALAGRNQTLAAAAGPDRR